MFIRARTKQVTFTLLTMLLFVALAPVHAESNPLDTQSDPVLLIGAYYRAISTGDYATAYGYWQQPSTQTEGQFAQGFADTTAAQVLVRLPVYVDAGAGNLYAAVPTWIRATHVDGSTHDYAGCFTLHKTDVPVGNATEPDPNWYIQKGELQEQLTLDLSVLDSACENSASLGSSPFPPQQTNPVALIQSYFNAVATARSIPAAVKAASYWMRPGGDSVQISYSDQLVSAHSLDLYIDPTMALASTHAAFPVLINITAPDESSSILTGCLGAEILDVPLGNLSAPYPNWYITDGALNHAPNLPDALSSLTTGCVS